MSPESPAPRELGIQMTGALRLLHPLCETGSAAYGRLCLTAVSHLTDCQPCSTNYLKLYVVESEA